MDICATLTYVLNKRRIAALALTATTAAAVTAVPSADAATVGKPINGVCSLQMSIAEKDFAAALPRDLRSPQAQQKQQWTNAFEVAFPEAAPIAQEFLEAFNGPYFRQFHANRNAETARWEDRIATAANVDPAGAKWYFTEIMNSVLVSSEDGLALDHVEFWRVVDDALESGTINATDPRDIYPAFPQEISDSRLEDTLADMPADQRKKWVNAHASSKEAMGSVNAAQFRDAFKKAREACANGGGSVTLPVAPKPTTPYNVPPVQRGKDKPGKTTEPSTPTESKTTTNISVDFSTSVERQKNEPQASMPVGAIIGIVVALLTIIGGAGAAFVMGGR